MRYQLSTVGSLDLKSSDVIAESHTVVNLLGMALLPVVSLLALAGVFSSVFQVGFLFVPSRLSPDVSRLSPISGLGRIFSMTGAMKLGFGMFKITIVAIVAAVVLFLRYEEVIYASGLSARRTGSFS